MLNAPKSRLASASPSDFAKSFTNSGFRRKEMWHQPDLPDSRLQTPDSRLKTPYSRLDTRRVYCFASEIYNPTMSKWNFEPGHTAAEFCVRHMMVTYVRGHFKNVHGRLNFDTANAQKSSVEVEIDARTL